MSDDQDGCERVNVSSDTGPPGQYRQRVVKWLCVYVCVCVCVVYETSGVHPSVCLSVPSCGGFAADRRANDRRRMLISSGAAALRSVTI